MTPERENQLIVAAVKGMRKWGCSAADAVDWLHGVGDGYLKPIAFTPEQKARLVSMVIERQAKATEQL